MQWLGGIALALFAFALIFPPISESIFSEETRQGVLIHAIPFFSAFIGILLLFILVIVLVALRFNGKMPGRSYSGIENTLVVGILFGVVCLFQPWSFVPYRYGFVILLGSTLGFILWSHVLPPRSDFDSALSPLTTTQKLIGAVIGVAVSAILMFTLVSANNPAPPYGLRDRVFNSYDDARKAEVAAAAEKDFNNVELPFLVLFCAFPGFIMYFTAREAVGSITRKTETSVMQPLPASGGD